MLDDKMKFARFTRPSVDRRTFLKVVGLSGAGFIVGCSRSDDTAAMSESAKTAGEAPVTVADLGPFVRIGSDNTVTVVVKHLDKGQGVTTGLPTIVAEELDADWSQMAWEFAPANDKIYNNLSFGPMQGTGGSSSVANSWMQLRQAAAAARAMLVQAAAARWQVPASEITVAGGVLSHASGKHGNFGEFAAAAADVTPPAEPALKDPADFKLIGSRVPRLDSPSKTDGTALFTLDISRPNMLVAMVAHPPRFGATVTSYDATAAKAVAGVQDVVQIPRGVAVLADSFWSAKKGRDALQVDWDYSKAENRGSDEMFADYGALAKGDGAAVATDNGDAATALSNGAKTARREFSFPFLAHATMEPMDCIAEITPEGCTIYTGCQFQTVDQHVAAAILGIQPEQVTINTYFAGGSFGRRAVPDSDFIAETVMIAKAIDGRAPVKLIWTREDDMRAGRYRPMSYHVMEGSVDADGNITGWRHKVTMQSFIIGTVMEGMMENGVDPMTVEGARNLPYAIPNLRVDLQLADNGVPTLWWRSVGHSFNAFATEVFFDEMAELAGRDPYEYRRELLAEHPRHLAVLNTVAEKAGWGETLEEGRGRGIAVHEAFGTLVAEVVDVSMKADGNFTVDKVTCAVDCGIAVNPDIIRAQMEGGIAYALSAALREQITLQDGEVVQGNFDRYASLRIDEMPDVEVHIVPSTQPPSGVGEPGVPPLAPALVNALYAASGKRVYRLPIGDQLKG